MSSEDNAAQAALTRKELALALARLLVDAQAAGLTDEAYVLSALIGALLRGTAVKLAALISTGQYGERGER